MPRVACVAALLVALSSNVWADTVWLKNGDRLTGKIQSVDSGLLVLNTEYGGDIRVKVEQVRTLESTDELVVLENGPSNQYRARLAAADDGSAEVLRSSNAGEAEPLPTEKVTLDAIDTISRPNGLLLDTAFKGRIDLTANRISATSKTQNIALAASLEARRDQWRNQLTASYSRAKDNGNISVNNYSGDYTLDRFLGEQAFWQGRVSHQRDFIEDLNRQTSYGTGPGYQFWDNELGAFSLAGLISRVHYGYSDDDTENFYAASVRWNYNRYLRGRQFEFYTKGEVAQPLGNAADYAFNTETGLRYNFTNWMSLYVKYERDVVSGSRQNLNETRYGTGVGVQW